MINAAVGRVRELLRILHTSENSAASGAGAFATHAVAVAAISLFALMLMWRPVLLGDVFMPLDALLHLHPWRYSYERVPVNNPNNLDPIRQTYPRRLITNDIVSQGQWPLWNRSILTGTPLLNDGQLAFFYPLSLIFLVAPLPWAFGFYAFVHLIIAGVGGYAFARQIKLEPGPALVAGVAYMLNGYMLTWLQLPHHVGATAMLPWCFWAVERALTGVRWRGWALVGAFMAMPLLCQIQLAFYIYVGLAGYVLARAVQLPDWLTRARVGVGFGLAVGLALVLSMVQLLPAIALSAQGQRAEIGVIAGSAEAQFKLLLRLVFPALEGGERIGTPSGWGPTLLQVPYPYIGLLPLALAVVGLLRTRHAQSFIFGLMATLSFALAVISPLLQLFLLLAPPYRQFEDHTRWFVLWGLAMAMLAGIGAQTLLANRATAALPVAPFRSTTDRHDADSTIPAPVWRLTWPDVRLTNRLLVGAIALFLAGWALWHLQLFTPQSRYGFYITLIRQQSLVVPALILAIGLASVLMLRMQRLPAIVRWGPLLLLITLDMSWHGGSYNTSFNRALIQPTADLTRGLAEYSDAMQQDTIVYPTTRQIAFLQSQPGPFRIFGSQADVLPPNLAGAFGLEDIRAYHSLYFKRYNRLARMIDGKDYSQTSVGSISLRLYFTSSYNHRRLLDMLNVEYLLFPPGSPDVDLYQPLELVQLTDEGGVYRNPQVLPRAWLVHTIETIADDQAQLARMAREDFDPATLAVTASAPPPVSAAEIAEPPPVVEYVPNRVTIAAEVAAPALLVLSDAYDDGWQVTVDDQPAPLYRANYALRGVWLPPGRHIVTFTYRPREFLFGGAVSLLALLGLLGYGLREWRRSPLDG